MTTQTKYNQIVEALSTTINKLPHKRRSQLMDKVGPVSRRQTPSMLITPPAMDVQDARFEKMAEQFKIVADKRETELLETRERANRQLRELRAKAQAEIQRYRKTATTAWILLAVMVVGVILHSVVALSSSSGQMETMQAQLAREVERSDTLAASLDGFREKLAGTEAKLLKGQASAAKGSAEYEARLVEVLRSTSSELRKELISKRDDTKVLPLLFE